jgi:hypothetical protein
VFTLALVFVGTQIIQDSEYIGREKFEALTQDVRGAVSFKDWLPVAARDFNSVVKMSGNAEAGTRSVSITAWEPERRTLHLGAGTDGVLRVRTYFYPRWTANAEGQTLPITANADGLILISAPTEASDIQLNFEPPTRVHLFEMVTLISWILISGSCLCAMIRMRVMRASINRFNAPAEY